MAQYFFFILQKYFLWVSVPPLTDIPFIQIKKKYKNCLKCFLGFAVELLSFLTQEHNSIKFLPVLSLALLCFHTTIPDASRISTEYDR